MKSFPDHLSLSALDYEPGEGSVELNSGDHPLVSELRRSVSDPAAATVGSFAHLVERMMRELSMVRAEVETSGSARADVAGGRAAVSEADAEHMAEFYADLDGDEPASRLM